MVSLALWKRLELEDLSLGLMADIQVAELMVADTLVATLVEAAKFNFKGDPRY